MKKGSVAISIILLCAAVSYMSGYRLPELDDHTFSRIDSILVMGVQNSTGIAVNSHYYKAFYHDNTNQIDSLKYYEWADQTFPGYWYVVSNEIFVYDNFGNLTERRFYYNNLPYYSNKIYYQYDDAGRLSEVGYQRTDQFENALYTTESFNFTYHNGYLQSSLNYKFSQHMNQYQFKKLIYALDGQGRIHESLCYYSPTTTGYADSSYWDISDKQVFSYNQEDDTTHEQLLQRMKHYFHNRGYIPSVGDFFVLDNIGDLGKLDSITDYYMYYDENWHSNIVFDYNYDSYGWLHEVVFYDGMSFVNHYKMDFDCDPVDGNLVYIDISHWNDNVWQPPFYFMYLFYSQVTSNQDEVQLHNLLELSANPNPFSGSLNIKFANKSNASTTMQIYNAKGQLVKQLRSNQDTALWDGLDYSGRPVANGIYLLKAEQNGIKQFYKVLRIH